MAKKKAAAKKPLTPMSLKDQLADLQKQQIDLQKQINNTAKAVLKEDADAVFEKYPELKSFGWTQYTPLFNDGDACEFSADVSDVYINGKNEYDWSNKEKKIYKPIAKEISDFLYKIPEESLEDMFGDGVLVEITPKAMNTSEYDDHY